MYILFQIEKESDKIVEVKPLFANNDCYYHTTSLRTITNCLNDIVEKLNTDENRKILFESLYAGNYEFSDVRDNRTFAILVRMKDEIPDEILRVEENYYNGISTCKELLNKENKDDSIYYKIFNVRGELE